MFKKLEEAYPQRMGAIYTLLGGAFWGASGTCGQYVFTHKAVTSLWLVPIRLLIAGVLLLGWYFCKNPAAALAPWREKRDRADLLLYGLAGVSLCQLMYFSTIQLSSAAVATVLQDISPIPILIASCILAKRRPTGVELVSIPMALLGVLLLVTHGSLTEFAVSPAALCTGMAAAMAVMVYNVFPARLLTRHPTPLLQGWSFLMGGVLLCGIFRPWQYHVRLDGQLLLALAVIIGLGNLLAFNIYMTGVRLIGPSKSILYGFSEPVTAAVLACLWLGAPFTGWDAAGFACVFAMLVLLSLPAKQVDPSAS